MKAIKSFFQSIQKLFDTIVGLIFICVLIVTFLFALSILQPALSPVMTLLFAFVVTIFGLSGSLKSVIISIIGILAYAFSWLVAKHFGALPAVSICGAGICIWLCAAFSGFNYQKSEKSKMCSE